MRGLLVGQDKLNDMGNNKPIVNNVSTKDLANEIVKLIDNADPILVLSDTNGLESLPFDKKKTLTYLKAVELYLTAQLAIVRKQINKVEEDLLQ